MDGGDVIGSNVLIGAMFDTLVSILTGLPAWVVIGVAVMAVIGLAAPTTGRRGRRTRRSNRWSSHSRIVAGAVFRRRPVMNRSEAALFRRLGPWVERRGGLYLFVQVSLGEIVETDDRRAWRCINDRRCDFLIADLGGMPLLAIEYQGGGHYRNNAAERDAVKRIALTRAGVTCIEVFADDGWDTVRCRLEQALAENAPEETAKGRRS